jgi:hypothetical protein
MILRKTAPLDNTFGVRHARSFSTSALDYLIGLVILVIVVIRMAIEAADA